MTTAGALDPKQLVAEQLEVLKRHRGWFRALGFAWIALGVIAILMPVAAALAIDVLVGWLLIFGGAAQTVHAFRVRPWHGSLLAMLWGLINLAAGAMLLLNPPSGVYALTVVLSALLLAEGVAKLLLGFRVRPHGSSGAFLLSGGLGIALGLMLWLGLPGTADWAIGTLVGLNMIFGGFATLHVVRKLA
jgi:uncharacterized membrane protein HdeD (DUF308 family)